MNVWTRRFLLGVAAFAVLSSLMLVETSLVNGLIEIEVDQPPPIVNETRPSPTTVDDLESVAVKSTVSERILRLETEDGKTFEVSFPITAHRIFVGKNKLSALTSVWLPGTVVVYCDKLGLSIASVDKNGAVEFTISFSGEPKEETVRKAVVAVMLGGKALDAFLDAKL